MGINFKIAGLAVLGIGSAAVLASCARSKPQDPENKTPFSDLAEGLVKTLNPSWKSGPLAIATQSVREVSAGGKLVGRFDGTNLLSMADQQPFGAPSNQVADDVKDDGKATLNEVRQLITGYDVSKDGTLQQSERRAFESAAGIRWIPA